MVIIEDLIESIILSDVDVTAIIGDRLYETFATPRTQAEAEVGIVVPYCTYHIYSNKREYTFDGAKNSIARCDVHCFTYSAEDSRNLKNLIITAFEDAQMVNSAMSLVDADEQNFYEQDTKLFHTVAPLQIWFR